MALVSATLLVVDGSKGFHGRQVLYQNVFGFEVSPREGDEVHILRNIEDHEWWFNHEVKRHYWNGDGSYWIEFRNILTDPTKEVEERNPFSSGGSPSRGYKTQWWTDRDGDIHAHLLAAGWVKY